MSARKGGECIDVGQYQPRLVEAADQVLAPAGVDAGLAADGAVDLRQQGGRDLHEVDAAQHDRGREPREVADYAAAQRHQRRAALDARRQQLVDHLFQLFEALGLLARRQDDGVAVDTRRGKGARQARQVQLGHRAVGQHHGARLPEHGLQVPAGVREQAAADQDVVAARAKLEAQTIRFDHCAARSAANSAAVALRRMCAASAPMTRSRVASGGPSMLSTVMSASA